MSTKQSAVVVVSRSNWPSLLSLLCPLMARSVLSGVPFYKSLERVFLHRKESNVRMKLNKRPSGPLT